jgi:uncharacterized LabA/DUF88 family protein
MNKTKKKNIPSVLKPRGEIRNIIPQLDLGNDKSVGIFIDDANMFYIQKEVGWKIDWNKFRNLILKYFKNVKFQYYLGMPLEKDKKTKNQKIQLDLEKIGFSVKTKPLKKIFIDNKRKEFKYKCNFDVEMALDVARMIDKLDVVIVISGDSDFLAVKDFCVEKHKVYLTICFERRVPWEIRKMKHVFFEEIKSMVQKNSDLRRSGVTEGIIAKK